MAEEDNKEQKADEVSVGQPDGMEETDEKPVNLTLLEAIQSDDKNTLSKVKIYSPYRVYFDDAADSVTAINLTGPFDILPGHKNFMTLLTRGDIIVRSKNGAQKLKIERGVMHVRKNVVEIFLDV
jgi:hypothetical protein